MMGNLLQVRSFGVNFFVLRDEAGLYLIDGGFIGGPRSLGRALRRKGWDQESVVWVSRSQPEEVMGFRSTCCRA